MGRRRATLAAACACAIFALVPGPAAAAVTTLEPSYRVAIERNVVVPMTDGTRLVADVYRPIPKAGQPAGQRFPCLFETTPYRKEMRAAEGAGYFPARGFVYMEMDARGTGGSEGEYDGVFRDQEQVDGYDGIEWMATKYPHCDGRVGMWGGSYSGVNQYLIAASPKGRPPHLRTIAPQRAFSDMYRDIVYTGGIVTGSFGLIWAGANTAFNAIGADPTTRPDPQIGMAALTQHMANDPLFVTLLNDPFDGPMYRQSSIIDRLAKLDIPTLHLVGLFDAFTRGQLHAVGKLLELEKRKAIKGPNYAVVGPWNHSGTHFLDQPPYDRWILDWYRHWLDDGPRPSWFRGERIRYCVMQEGRDGRCDWRAANWWPPRRGYQRMYLRGDGSLSRERPEGRGTVGQWTWNPFAGQGENFFSKWDNAAFGPQRDGDQAAEDEWKGLTFSTPALEEPLVVRGPITLTLRAATRPIGMSVGTDVLSQQLPGLTQLTPPYHDTDIVVKLSDVAPNGRSTLVQSGFLRASHATLDHSRTLTTRSGEVLQPVYFHTRERLTPPAVDRVRTYHVEIWPTMKRFARGHRLRIALYSADNFNHFTLLKPAVNTVHAGSFLLLPVAAK